MTDPRTADVRLRRILHVLPAAARDGGAALDELARELDVEPATVLRDLEEVTARSLYLPPGPADDLQIQLTADRVRVWTKGDFGRPVKLLTREALALGLGLRALAGTGEAARNVAPLRRRLERHLATAGTDALQPLLDPRAGAPSSGGSDGSGSSSTASGASREADVQGRLFAAARDRRPCRIRYLKPGAAETGERTLHPYVVVRAEGRWYAVGRDPGVDDVRTFRMDRVLEAVPQDGSFEVPGGFDVSDYVSRGAVFEADEVVEVVVRYSPRIARWIREKPWAGDVAESEVRAGGSLVVRHRVADPRWIVGHVLQYGPDAEVLEPENVRERMRETLEGIA